MRQSSSDTSRLSIRRPEVADHKFKEGEDAKGPPTQSECSVTRATRASGMVPHVQHHGLVAYLGNNPEPTKNLLRHCPDGASHFSRRERHWPSWREARLVLNELPLAAEAWPKERGVVLTE